MTLLENILSDGGQLRGALNNKYTNLKLAQHILYSHRSLAYLLNI